MSMDTDADTVLVSENVLTMSDRDDTGSSFVAIKDGRIAAVEPLSALSSWAGSGTEVIDVGDRLVLPGFIDTHCHLEKHARTTYKSVDVRAPRCASIADVTSVDLELFTLAALDADSVRPAKASANSAS